MAQESSTGRSDTGVLALGALGVVFGDIGTSPLYAFREAFDGHGHELEVAGEQRARGAVARVLVARPGHLREVPGPA